MPEATEAVKSNKTNSIFLANQLLMDLREFGTYLIWELNEKSFYIFTGKIYEQVDDRKMDEYIYKFVVRHEITSIWKTQRLTEIKRAILMSELCEKVELNSSESKICFNNGVFDMDTMELIPHSRNFYFSEMVDVNFNPNAKTPAGFIKFVHDIFKDPNTGEVDIKSVELIKQIGGYLLYPRNVVEKMFIFMGNGANGKSLLLNAFSMFFDRKNVSCLSLEQLSKQSFDRTTIIGSRVNISTEQKGSAIDPEEIKKIISGEPISMRQLYKQQFSYVPRTKIIVATNAKLYFNDTSNAMERRLLFVDFKNRFLPKKEYAAAKANEKYKYARLMEGVPKEQIIEMLKTERDGILLFFLSGLKDLRANGWEFTESNNSKALKHEFVSSNDTASHWLRESYTIAGKDEFSLLTATEILEDYRQWYHDNVSIKALNFSTITMASKIREVFFIESSRVTKDGKRYVGFPLVKKTEVDFHIESLDQLTFNDKL